MVRFDNLKVGFIGFLRRTRSPYVPRIPKALTTRRHPAPTLRYQHMTHRIQTHCHYGIFAFVELAAAVELVEWHGGATELSDFLWSSRPVARGRARTAPRLAGTGTVVDLGGVHWGAGHRIASRLVCRDDRNPRPHHAQGTRPHHAQHPPARHIVRMHMARRNPLGGRKGATPVWGLTRFQH